jgi:hypothetical protein
MSTERSPRPTAADVVFQADDRCDQENLIAQLKGGQGAGDAGGRPGEQLGIHVDGVSGLEPEGVECPDAAGGGGPVGGAAPGREAVVAADGVRDVLYGADPDAVSDGAEWATVALPAVVLEPVATRVPAAGEAVAVLPVVLRQLP